MAIMQDLMAAPHARSHSFRRPACAERTRTPSKNAGVSVRAARMSHAYPARSMARADESSQAAVDSLSWQRLQPMAMKTALAPLLLVLLVSAACADDGSASAPPSGRLEAPELVYDAGKVERGMTVRHDFVLKNIGTAELSVDAKPG